MYDTHIVIEILINGNWVELAAMPIENPSTVTEEAKEETIKEFEKLLYNCEKTKFFIPGTSIVIRNMDKQFSIFRVRSIIHNF